jgi:hypothetical protein
VNDTQDLFANGKSEKEIRIETAKNILINEGYRISLPTTVNGSINSKRKLRDYFYMRLDARHPDRQRTHIPNERFDYNILSQFIESQKEGVNEQVAIQECVAIIDVIFNYEKELNLKYPIADIGILGQNKLAWITMKAASILNRLRAEAMEREAYKKIEAMEDAYEVNHDEISKNLDALLKGMEENNGEE